MQDFRKLNVWQRGHELVLAIYQATESFPSTERFGLTSQMRRSATSIPSLVAEGCGRGTDADFARFLQMGLGSASELEYQLLLSRDLALLDEETYEQLNGKVVEVKRMLAGLKARLRTTSAQVPSSTEVSRIAES